MNQVYSCPLTEHCLTSPLVPDAVSDSVSDWPSPSETDLSMHCSWQTAVFLSQTEMTEFVRMFSSDVFSSCQNVLLFLRGSLTGRWAHHHQPVCCQTSETVFKVMGTIRKGNLWSKGVDTDRWDLALLSNRALTNSCLNTISEFRKCRSGLSLCLKNSFLTFHCLHDQLSALNLVL